MPAARPFGKVDIVHHLADRYAYRRYLEIATPTTGNYYALIDRTRFDDCRRLIYRCPAEFDDGSVIDYRCPGSDIGAALSAIAAPPLRRHAGRSVPRLPGVGPRPCRRLYPARAGRRHGGA